MTSREPLTWAVGGWACCTWNGRSDIGAIEPAIGRSVFDFHASNFFNRWLVYGGRGFVPPSISPSSRASKCAENRSSREPQSAASIYMQIARLIEIYFLARENFSFRAYNTPKPSRIYGKINFVPGSGRRFEFSLVRTLGFNSICFPRSTVLSRALWFICKFL